MYTTMMQRSTDAELAKHRMCRQSENRAGKTADVTYTHQTHAHTHTHTDAKPELRTKKLPMHTPTPYWMDRSTTTNA